jgi:hypothetical protein
MRANLVRDKTLMPLKRNSTTFQSVLLEGRVHMLDPDVDGWKMFKGVKFSLCLTNEALRYEEVWVSGRIEPPCIVVEEEEENK